MSSMRDRDLEDPAVANAERTGYAAFQSWENRDTPENREEYIDSHTTELVLWLRREHPHILEEFIEASGGACMIGYQNWLN